MSKEIPEISPCPYCGGEAVLYELDFGRAHIDEFWVHCDSDYHACEGPIRATRRGAINAWNKRLTK